MDRSSRPEMFYRKYFLRNFAKFRGKHLYESLFFNKVATLLKRGPWHRSFPVTFARFLRTPFLTEHLRWLLLNELWFCYANLTTLFNHVFKSFLATALVLYPLIRGGSRTAATSKMEFFVIIVNGFHLLTIFTKSSILGVAAILDPPLLHYKTSSFLMFSKNIRQDDWKE